MRHTALLLAFLAAPLSAQWPEVRRDTALEHRLEALASEMDGVAGFYVRHLETGRGATIRADELFPTASVIKVPILGATFDRLERGELRYDTVITWADSLRYGDDDGLVNQLADSAALPLSFATLMMITTSDNAAALLLQALAGGGERINQWLADNGFDSTRVNSRTPGRSDNWEQYGWGQTSPREIAELVVRMREGTLVSPAASEAMYRHLTRIYWNGVALAELPPWVQAASKQGMVRRSRAEVVLVNAPSGDYVFAVMTRDQNDTSYDRGNQGYELIRKTSRLLWQTFEPDHPWRPAEGAERYMPE
ncbi:MAG TPA: class A beta-lactamase-related serine hydrolase [Gemmatimonadales bacterium]|nr:class A beta-lactamase-related serine hydrolase [Gemmatimonadales bacterium]